MESRILVIFGCTPGTNTNGFRRRSGEFQSRRRCGRETTRSVVLFNRYFFVACVRWEEPDLDENDRRGKLRNDCRPFQGTLRGAVNEFCRRMAFDF
jgi:hypothetical protein